MTITSNLRFLYIFGGSGLLCAVAFAENAHLRRISEFPLKNLSKSLLSPKILFILLKNLFKFPYFPLFQLQ